MAITATPAAIGLLGGSFDPVHLGHIALADTLRQRFGFQEVRLLPAARSPLKPQALADHHRLAMLELAIASKQGLTIDPQELKRPAPSYTIDTLKALRANLGAAQPLVFILGQDSFADLFRWKDWQALTDYAHLLVVNRPGHPRHVPDTMTAWLHSRLRHAEDSFTAQPHGGVWQVDTPPYEVASRDIRAAIRAGKSVKHWLNPAVADYIAHHHLYSGDTPPQ